MRKKVFQVQVLKNRTGWDAHAGMVYDVIRAEHTDQLYQLMVTERNTANMDKVCEAVPGQIEYRDHMYKTGRAHLPMSMTVVVAINNEGSLYRLKEEDVCK